MATGSGSARCAGVEAARLAGRVHHSVGHDFFTRSRWSTDEVGLRLLDLSIARFVAADRAIGLAVDGSVFRRCGRKVRGAVSHHDASARRRRIKYGNCFVVLGFVVRFGVSASGRGVCRCCFGCGSDAQPSRLPGPSGASQQDLAAVLIGLVAERYPGRRVDVVGDSAFACSALGALPEQVTVTSRLRSNAVISEPKPPPTGKRGRPRVTGRRLGNPGEIAAAAKPGDWQPVGVPGRGDAKVLIVEGLWYSVFGPRTVRVMIVRESADTDGYEIALITTDLDSSAARIIARYADRWSMKSLPRRQADRRRRRGPQPRQTRRRTNRAVRVALPDHHDRVVRAARRPRRRRATPTPQRTVVPEQTRPLDARYPSIAAARTDPQRISRTSRPRAETPANPPCSATADRRRRIDHESRGKPTGLRNVCCSFDKQRLALPFCEHIDLGVGKHEVASHIPAFGG